MTITKQKSGTRTLTISPDSISNYWLFLINPAENEVCPDPQLPRCITTAIVLYWHVIALPTQHLTPPYIAGCASFSQPITKQQLQTTYPFAVWSPTCDMQQSIDSITNFYLHRAIGPWLIINPTVTLLTPRKRALSPQSQKPRSGVAPMPPHLANPNTNQ